MTQSAVFLLGVFACALVAGALVQGPARADDPAPNASIVLFNGKDLGQFYTFLKDRGRDTDPQKVFTVENGLIRISGQEFGCLTTKDEYENYHLVAEFKWGEKTYPPRDGKARDSGILLHSVGADGAYSGIWMHSIECQMIEGGTGDVLVVGDGSDQFAVTCPVAPEQSAGCYVYRPGGKPVTIHGGRINWFGRDPEWKDVAGFRGAKDVEKPLGPATDPVAWNRLECLVQGPRITIILNGVTVNECLNAAPAKGRIQIQSEGAEVFFRRFELLPIEQGTKTGR